MSVGRHLAIYGFTLLFSLAIQFGFDKILICLKKPPVEKKLVKDVLVSYFLILQNEKRLLTTHLFSELEEIIKIFDPEETKSFQRRLILYAPSLPIFLKKLSEMYLPKIKSMKSGELEKEINNDLKNFILCCELRYEEILETIIKFKKGELNDKITKLVYKSPLFRSQILLRFSSQSVVKEEDYPTIKQIYSLKTPEIVQISSETLSEMLLPSVSDPSVNFSQMLKEIVLSFGEPTIGKFVKERVIGLFNKLSQIDIIKNLEKELKGFEKCLLPEKISCEFFQQTLNLLMKSLKNANMLIEISVYFEYFTNEKIKNDCLKWVYQNVEQTLNSGNYEPLLVLGKKYRNNPDKKVLESLFHQIAMHFEKNVVKESKPIELILNSIRETSSVNDVLEKYGSEIECILTFGKSSLVPETFEKVEKAHKQIKTFEVTLHESRSICEKSEGFQEKICEILHLSHKDASSLDSVKNDLQNLIKNYTEMKNQWFLFKETSKSITFLSDQEANKFVEIVKETYNKENEKLLVDLLNNLPTELVLLKPNLEKYQLIKDNIPIKMLISNEFGKKLETMSSFSENFSIILTLVKSSMLNIIKNLPEFTMDKFHQTFGQIRNIKKEVKCILSFVELDDKPEGKEYKRNLKNMLRTYKERLGILEKLKNILLIAEIINFHDDPFYAEIKKYLSDCGQEISSISTSSFVEMTQSIKKKQITLFGEYTDIINEFLTVCANSYAFLKYLKSSDEAFLLELKKHVNDFDDKFIKRSSFDEFFSLRNFMLELQNKKTSRDTIDFCVNYFKENRGKIFDILQKGPSIHTTLLKLSRRIHEKAILYMENIEDILNKSELKLRKKNTSWKLFIAFGSGEAANTKFDYAQLQELSKRAALERDLKIEEQKEKGEKIMDIEKYNIYLELTKNVSKIIDKLESLDDLSYPECEEIISLPIVDRNLDSHIIPYLKMLQAKYEEWNLTIIRAYKKNLVLTYWVPSQFWIIEEYLANSKSSSNQSAVDLLKFAGIEITEEDLSKKPFTITGSPEVRLGNLGEYLHYWMKEETEPKYSGLGKSSAFISNKLLEGVYFIYANSEFPEVSQLLFCDENIKWEKVLSFFFRALFFPHKIHSFVYVERLPYEMQLKLVDLFETNQKNQSPFPFGFISKTEDSLIIKHLLAVENIQITKEQTIENKIINEFIKKSLSSYDKIKIIKSGFPGMGKTTYITSESKSVRYITFAGEVTYEEIGEQLLSNSKFLKSGSTLCLKVHRVNNKSILDEIFYQILIQHCFQYGSQIVYIPESCTIYIEIENTYKELLASSITVKNYLQNYKIGGLHILMVIDPNILCFKRVGNYLNKLETPGWLDTNNISEENMEIVKVDDVCDRLEKIIFTCQKLIELPLLQVSITIKFISKMLENLEKSVFRPDILSNYGFKPEKNIRSSLIKEIIYSCKLLADNSINDSSKLLNNQIYEEDCEVEIPDEFIKQMYDTVTPFRNKKLMNICFTESGYLVPLKFSKTESNDNIKKFLRIQDEILKKEKKPGLIDIKELNYENMKHEDYVLLLQQIFQKDKLLTGDYVLTFDNFTKMMYIYMRASSNIPMVIMGETGCGKTRMIHFLSETILGHKLIVFNIHAGITKKDILLKVNSLNDSALAHPTRKFWLFFDEFNTNENLGYISEIICDRMINNVSLSPNIIFICACNPYKICKGQSLLDENAGLPKERLSGQKSQKLMYKVFQLPKTQMFFVWDFGSLLEADEKEYINAILGTEPDVSPMLKNVIVELVVLSHNFFRECDDMNIISLRDIMRYKTLFNWFHNMRKIKPEKAAILSLIFCFFYRISNEDKRIAYIDKVEKCLKKTEQEIFRFDIHAIRKEEAKSFLSHFKLPPNVVWTKSLRENLYSMIVCILNKIPLIVIGKPGCSKTLALKILVAHFQGKNSNNKFFEEFPEVLLFSFQGSLSCQSQDIKAIFLRAKQALKSGEKILPVVFIDEIGLCELSPYNPLKVLHELLEIEALDIGFVGISNWRLDAAKMNRLLYLIRQPFQKKEIRKIAIEMYKLRKPGLIAEKDKNILDSIAALYHYFQNECKESESSYKDIYGHRDYYDLLSYFSKHAKEDNTINEQQFLVKEAIMRNFDIQNMKDIHSKPLLNTDISNTETLNIDLWKKFLEFEHENAHNIEIKKTHMDIIKSSIGDCKNRYVLLVGNTNMISILLSIKFHNETKHMRPFVGSLLEHDQQSKDYISKVLSQIVYCVEKGLPIIFNKLQSAYSHLYDLFNQYSGAESCRIETGTDFHPDCKIHKNFFCIVLMEEKEFEKEQIPLLNRFEKHFISLSDALVKQDTDIENLITNKLNKSLHIEMSENEKDTQYGLNNYFVNMDSNTDIIKLFLLSARAQSPKATTSDIIAQCQENLFKLGTMDLLVALVTQLKSPDLTAKEKEVLEEFLKLYKKNHEKSFKEELIHYSTECKRARLLYFTYMNKSEKVERALGEHSSRIVFISLSMFKSEEALTREVARFFTTPEYNLLIVEIDFAFEEAHIDHMHSIISAYEGQDKSNSKNVCLLLYVKRNREKEPNRLVYFQDYSMKMFDGMNENTESMIDTLNSPITVIVMNELENSFENKIKMWLSKAFTRVNRTICGLQDERRGDFSLDLLNKIASNPKMIKILKMIIKESISSVKDIEKKMSERLSAKDSLKYSSVLEGVNRIATDKIENSLAAVIYQIEKHSAFDSYFNPPPDHAEEITKLWRKELENLLINFSSNEFPSIISIIGLQFPFSKLLEEKITDIYRNVSIKDQNEKIENLFRSRFCFGESNKWMMSLLMRDFLLIKIVKIEMNMIDVALLDMLLQTASFSAFDVNLETIEQFVSFLNNKEQLLRSYISVLEICRIFLVPDTEKILKSKAEKIDFEVIFKSKCTKLIDKVIEHLEPSKATMGKFKKNIGVYLCMLLKIKMLAISIGVGPKLKNKDLLSLWIDVAECAQESSRSFLEETYKYFEKLKSSNPSPALVVQSSDFLTLMFSIFDNYKKLSNSRKYSLKFTLYDSALKGNKEGYIEKLADEFKNQEASPYLVTLVQRIEERIKILDIKFEDIKKTTNWYISNVNRYLEKNGLDCPFGVLIFNSLWKKFNEKQHPKSSRDKHSKSSRDKHSKSSRDKHSESEEKSTKDFRNAIDLINGQKGTPFQIMFALLHVKSFLNSFLDHLSSSSDPPEKSKFLQLFGIIDTTCELYMYKITDNKSLQKYLDTKFCKTFLSIAEAESLKIIFDYDNKFTTLIRHLKLTMNREKDQSIEKFNKMLSNCKDNYQNTVDFCFAIINELYILYIGEFDHLIQEFFKYWSNLEYFKDAFPQNLREFITRLILNFHNSAQFLTLKKGLIVDNQINLIISYSSSILLSAYNEINPFSSCFYSSKGSSKTFCEKISESYLFGQRDEAKKETKGYWELESESGSIREMSDLTYGVLCTIRYSILYCLYIISKEEMENLFSKEVKVEEHLITNLRRGLNIVRNKICVEKIDEFSFMKLVLKEFAKKLPNMMKGLDANSAKNRKEFEKLFQNEIVHPLLNSKEAEKFHSGLALSEFINSEGYFSFEELIKEKKFDPYFPCLPFFKKTSEKILKENLYKCSKEIQKAFPIIFTRHSLNQENSKSSSDNTFQSMKNLMKYAWKVIKPFLMILEQYDYQITRAEAKTAIIDIKKNESLSQVITELQNNWSEISGNFPPIPEDQKNSIEIPKTLQTLKLEHFLLDNDTPQGKGLIFVLKSIIDTHNYFIAQLLTIIDTEMPQRNLLNATPGEAKLVELLDKKHYPLSIIREEHLIGSNHFDIDAVKYGIFSEHYCKEPQTYYDFSMIQINIIKDVMNKKIINNNSIPTIHYKGEFHSQQYILDLCRSIIENTKLTEKEIDKIQSCVKSQKAAKNPTDLLETLKNIMYYLCESRFTAKSNLTLKEFCERQFGVSSLLTLSINIDEIGSLSVNKIVHIYEVIEIECFDNVYQNISPAFKKNQFAPEDKKTLLLFLKSIEKKYKGFSNQLLSVVKKYIVRYVNEKSETSDLIKKILFMEKMWASENYSDYFLQEIKKEFPFEQDLSSLSSFFDMLNSLQNEVEEVESRKVSSVEDSIDEDSDKC